ncbi:hypothetical protein AB6D20_004085 [Vibrio splendidus]|uniref:hypothetical protein n=1 Tax=Vibrio TaxID=662 RepID=UPI0016002A26|nr:MULTISPECIES: hypothetical protein [Vibrio]MBB1465791.1 hypothetical protein [Vibrio sp. SG41-7]MDH5897767.1 hypothetical protein [Vibrio splendidus]
MTTSTSVFVKTNRGVKNLALAKSVIGSDERVVVLDSNCNVMHYQKGAAAETLFEQIKKSIKPCEGATLILENGSWIHVDSISNVFISEKSGSLLITANKDDNLLTMFAADEFSDLEGLCDVLCDALCDYNDGKAVPEISWSEYKA